MKGVNLSQVFQVVGYGFLPLLLLCLLGLCMQQTLSAPIVLAISIVLLGYALLKRSRNRQNLLIYPTTSILLCYAFLLWAGCNNKIAVSPAFLFELLVLIHLGIVLILRHRIRKWHDKYLKKGCSSIYSSLELTFSLCTVLCIFTAIHLVVALSYGIYTHTYISSNNVFFSFGILSVIFGTLYLIHWGYAIWIVAQMGKECWIPLIDISGNVTGKIPYSILEKEDIPCMIPVVRVIYEYEGMYYMMASGKGKENAGQIDLPVETFVRFGESMDACLKRIMDATGLTGRAIKPRLLSRYEHKVKGTNRKHLVFLYIVTADKADLFAHPYFKGGKLWSIKQLTDNFGTDYLARQLESELLFINPESVSSSSV